MNISQEAETAQMMSRLPDADAHTMARLHESLEASATADGLLDLSYRTVETPLGTLLLAATERGLIRIAYDREDHEMVLELLAAKVSPRILKSAFRLDPVARQLDEYFTGRRRAFDLVVDLRLSAGFRREVLARLSQIGYGRTESYAEVAAAAGNPKAVRAVGSACATNPVPVVIPCHRVLRSDGSLGGYVGGLAAKQALLRLEAASADA